MRRWRWVIVAGLLVAVAALVVAGRPLLRLALDEGHVLVEGVMGETPERRVAAYFAAITGGDRDAALAAWPLPEGASDELRQRREAMTDELLGLHPSLRYSIIDIQWWRNCCEPGLAEDPAYAGVARVSLKVSRGGSGELRFYTIDVMTPTAYWGAAGGDPVRHWLLRDVYSSLQPPLAFPWPVAAAAPVLSLDETERDQSRWLTYSSEDWPISLRYPPGWSVVEIVYAKWGYGPVIRIAAGDRVLELVRRGGPPPGPWSPSGIGNVGPFPAHVYEMGGGDGPRVALLVPVLDSDSMAYARVELEGTVEDEGYLEVYQAVLDSIVFG